MGKRVLQRIGRMYSTPATFFLLVFLTVIVASGCGGPRTYIHPNPGLDAIRKLAVVPFTNLAQDGNAASRVRVYFIIELLKTGSFDVMDIGETDRLMKMNGLGYDTSPIPAIGISRGGPAAETEAEDTAVPLSKQIGEALKVQAILTGFVHTYGSQRSGAESTPEVSITARLIDVETGIIIWAGNHTRRGSAGIPIVGWGKRTSMSLVARKVVEDMAENLAAYTFE
ncbi:hypothetical protein ACFL6S_36050 [Candidatus Poribacteria bacterium]